LLAPPYLLRRGGRGKGAGGGIVLSWSKGVRATKHQATRQGVQGSQAGAVRSGQVLPGEGQQGLGLGVELQHQAGIHRQGGQVFAQGGVGGEEGLVQGLARRTQAGGQLVQDAYQHPPFPRRGHSPGLYDSFFDIGKLGQGVAGHRRAKSPHLLFAHVNGIYIPLRGAEADNELLAHLFFSRSISASMA